MLSADSMLYLKNESRNYVQTKTFLFLMAVEISNRWTPCPALICLPFVFTFTVVLSSVNCSKPHCSRCMKGTMTLPCSMPSAPLSSNSERIHLVLSKRNQAVNKLIYLNKISWCQESSDTSVYIQSYECHLAPRMASTESFIEMNCCTWDCTLLKDIWP